MMSLKIIFLSIFALAALSQAQQYIDIDLSPPPKKQEQKKSEPQIKVVQPKTKPAPKQQPQTAPKTATHVRPPAKPAATKQPPQQKPVARPTEAPSPTAPTQRPVPSTPAQKQPLKLVTPTPVPPPVPAPTAPVPVPTPAPPVAPVAKPTLPAPMPAPVPKVDPAPISPKQSAADLANQADLDIDAARFKNRHAVAIDYSTWYEMIKMTEMTSKKLTEANSHYFGVAFSYDFTSYREKWGYAFIAGAITGNAQAGTKDSGDYFERRIPWTGYRAGGRLFVRASNRIDIGLGFIAQSKNTNWPTSTTYTIIPQANPQYFYYLDTRWRLNYKYELIQSFGAHLRSYSMAWMLGLSYTLN